MKRSLRLRILTILTITTIAAVAFALSRPFDPSVTFASTTAAIEALADRGTQPCLKFSIRNDGLLPVWYSNSGPRSCDMISRQFPANETADWAWLMPNQGEWTRIDPRAAATVSVPFYSGTTQLKIGIKLTDWRGRQTECWSPVVNPTQLQKDG